MDLSTAFMKVLSLSSTPLFRSNNRIIVCVSPGPADVPSHPRAGWLVIRHRRHVVLSLLLCDVRMTKPWTYALRHLAT